MPSTTCHCSALRIEVPRSPKTLTNWEPVRRTSRNRAGVIARNFEPEAPGAVRIRRLDGASSWKFLD